MIRILSIFSAVKTGLHSNDSIKCYNIAVCQIICFSVFFCFVKEKLVVEIYAACCLLARPSAAKSSSEGELIPIISTSAGRFSTNFQG